LRFLVGAIISRFAPAPTGFLHLGHVVNAIYVWGVARRYSGRVLLRIEDHDRVRSRPEFEAAILDDLQWLGFTSDEPLVRQSERGDIYLQTLDALRRQGLVYACSCTRATIASRTGEQPLGRDGGPARPALQEFLSPNEQRYPGTCRHRKVAETPGVGIRIRLDPSTERFVDLRRGPQEQRPVEQCGDLLARDREGNWTYQFAAVADDYEQGVTLVIRGDDLLSSTGRQIQLARLIGRAHPPRFLHHALIMKSATHPSTNARGALSRVEGQKLSKSDGDTGVRNLRERGWTPARVIGHASALAGLIPEPRDVHAEEVSSMMDAFPEALL
jgi:glutamyl/glutaminyl-tRNA synthetase